MSISNNIKYLLRKIKSFLYRPKYSDEHLQDHELNYWLTSYDVNAPLHHEDFYKEFFNFKELLNKNVVEVGCGGSPISEYTDMTSELTLVEPLLDKLTVYEKFKFLKKHKRYSVGLFNFYESNFDYVVCLNVIDHFNDPEYMMVDKFYQILNDCGELWLYYDVRSVNDSDHLAIDNHKLMHKLEYFFEIKKIDNSINPVHVNWSFVDYSVRLIARKRNLDKENDKR